jgi:hypothetical protein
LPESNSTICVDTWNKINGYAVHLNWYDLFRRNFPNGVKANDPERYGEVEINGEK